VAVARHVAWLITVDARPRLLVALRAHGFADDIAQSDRLDRTPPPRFRVAPAFLIDGEVVCRDERGIPGIMAHSWNGLGDSVTAGQLWRTGNSPSH
jgi:hypothetical protein